MLKKIVTVTQPSFFKNVDKNKPLSDDVTKIIEKTTIIGSKFDIFMKKSLGDNTKMFM